MPNNSLELTAISPIVGGEPEYRRLHGHVFSYRTRANNALQATCEIHAPERGLSASE